MPLTLCVAAATVSTLVIPRPALCCWPIVNPAEGVHAFPTLSARAKLTIYGGSSSAGRASDCGSECRGFKSHLPPHTFPSLYAFSSDGSFWCALCVPCQHLPASFSKLSLTQQPVRDLREPPTRSST